MDKFVKSGISLIISILAASCSSAVKPNEAAIYSSNIKNTVRFNLNEKQVPVNKIKFSSRLISNDKRTNSETDIKISPEAKKYYENAINIMEQNFIRRDKINWDFVRNESYKYLKLNTVNTEDTYLAILRALYLLKEKHSFFMAPNGDYLFPTGYFNDDSSAVIKVLKSESKINIKENIPKDIGYVKVRDFNGSFEEAVIFAQNIENSIIKQDTSFLDKWIIDLRGNGGGNMWPMLAGLLPILGEETPGYFYYPDGRLMAWDFSKTINTYGLKGYKMHNQNSKIAVLLDENVASSGEVTAISFIGKKNTKTFGQPTAGYSTCNTTIPLGDGASLVITNASLMDRNKKQYGDKITPDFIINNNDTLNAAVKWLYK